MIPPRCRGHVFVKRLVYLFFLDFFKKESPVLKGHLVLQGAPLGWALLGCAPLGWAPLGWAPLGWAPLGWAPLG